MAKTIWKGHINFGMVNVPVQLSSATERRRLGFQLIDRRDQNSVGYLKVNKETGREVRPEEIARAIDVDGQLVVVEDEDFERADPGASRSIDVAHFVRLDQIEPAYFEKPYFLKPMEGAERSYALLREVIERTKRVGIARVVLRKREHLAALIVHDGALMLNLIRYPRELRDPGDLELPTETPRELGITTDSIEMATELVERMTEDWQPEQYRDEYREELLELIEQKAREGRGERPELPEQAAAPPPHEEEAAPDLGEQLRRSIDRMR